MDLKASSSADITNGHVVVDGETISKWPESGRSTIRTSCVPTVMARW